MYTELEIGLSHDCDFNTLHPANNFPKTAVHASHLTPNFMWLRFRGNQILFYGTMIRNLNVPVGQGILYQSLVTAPFRFVMWNTLIQKYGATALHSFIFLMPISGAALGMLLLNEEITVNLLGSIAFVAARLMVINWKQRIET